MEQQTKPLLPLFAFLQETVAFIFSACTRAEKLTPHLHFSVSPCLEPYSAGGKSEFTDSGLRYIDA
jgi:hypothetical protein